MSPTDIDLEKATLEQKFRVNKQIAFASGLFQEDVTIRTLLESLAEGVIVIDNSGTILLTNFLAEQMFGYAKEDLIGKPHAILIPERLRRIHEEHQVHFFAEPKIRPMGRLLELYGCRQDGSEFPLEISLSFLATIAGVLVLAFVSDITESKKVREALRESEQRFASFMHNLPAAAWMKDLHGRYVYANTEAERVFSRPLSALQGKTDEEMFPPDIARQFRENDERVLLGGGHLQTIEVLPQSDRLEHQSIVSKFAVPGPDGQPAYLAGVAFDITETRRTQEALRKSEDRFSKIFQSVPALIGITTLPEGRCIDINEKGLQTLGYQREEIIGKTMLELGVWESRSARDHVLGLFEEKGVVRDLEIRFRGKGGKTFTGLFSAELIDLDGARYMLSMVNDITDRKRMEEENSRLNDYLEATNKELEAFNYTVAHDLRQPLSVMNSYCQVIDRLCGDGLTEDCKGYIREAYDITLRMDRLIDALLNFSRVGHVQPRKEPVDLSMLAHEVAEVLKLNDPIRQVDFQIADRLVAKGEASLLRVVLDNLLGNAWKYTSMQKQAIIEFGVKDSEGWTTYFVRDNGIGFDMKDASKLFTPFQRFVGAERFRGFGIGLATVERIVRQHGGRVWAEGKSGQGACIYFTLPDSDPAVRQPID